MPYEQTIIFVLRKNKIKKGGNFFIIYKNAENK